jgi:hypothetical protein
MRVGVGAIFRNDVDYIDVKTMLIRIVGVSRQKVIGLSFLIFKCLGCYVLISSTNILPKGVNFWHFGEVWGSYGAFGSNHSLAGDQSAKRLK